MLTHGPITVTCTRRYCAVEIETPLTVSTRLAIRGDSDRAGPVLGVK